MALIRAPALFNSAAPGAYVFIRVVCHSSRDRHDGIGDIASGGKWCIKNATVNGSVIATSGTKSLAISGSNIAGGVSATSPAGVLTVQFPSLAGP